MTRGRALDARSFTAATHSFFSSAAVMSAGRLCSERRVREMKKFGLRS